MLAKQLVISDQRRDEMNVPVVQVLYPQACLERVHSPQRSRGHCGRGSHGPCRELANDGQSGGSVHRGTLGSGSSRGPLGWGGRAHARMGGSAPWGDMAHAHMDDSGRKTAFHEPRSEDLLRIRGFHSNSVHLCIHGVRDMAHVRTLDHNRVPNGHHNHSEVPSAHRDRNVDRNDRHDQRKSPIGRRNLNGNPSGHRVHNEDPILQYDGHLSRTLACDLHRDLEYTGNRNVLRLGMNQSVRTCNTQMAHRVVRFSLCQ